MSVARTSSERIRASTKKLRVPRISAVLAAEASVIRLRFGLSGEEPRTLRQAGSELGITAERARQLEEQGLRRLAATSELEGLSAAA